MREIQGVKVTKVGIEVQPDIAKEGDDAHEILSGVTLVEDLQDAIVDRLDRAGHEETAGVAQDRKMGLMLEQVLDLDGHVVGDMREPPVQLLDDAHGMGGAVEEIGITKGDVLRPGRHLLGDVRQDHLRLHHEESPAVDRHDRAVAAKILAAAAGLGVADHARVAIGQRHVRVFLESGQLAAIGDQEPLSRQGDRWFRLRLPLYWWPGTTKSLHQR